MPNRSLAKRVPSNEIDAESVGGKFAALACAILCAAAGVASHAQAAAGASRAAGADRPQAPAAPPPAQAAKSEYPKVALTAGRSTVLPTDFNISRIAITNPAVADATVVQPREILIDGKAPGTISLIVWGRRADAVRRRRRTAGHDASAEPRDAVSW